MIVDYLPSDDAIYIVGKDPTSDWLQVESMDRDRGWIFKECHQY